MPRFVCSVSLTLPDPWASLGPCWRPVASCHPGSAGCWFSPSWSASRTGGHLDSPDADAVEARRRTSQPERAHRPDRQPLPEGRWRRDRGPGHRGDAGARQEGRRRRGHRHGDLSRGARAAAPQDRERPWAGPSSPSGACRFSRSSKRIRRARRAQGTEVQPGGQGSRLVGQGQAEPPVGSSMSESSRTSPRRSCRKSSDTLNRSGRFQVGMGDAMNVWLGQQGIRRAGPAGRQGARAAGRAVQGRQPPDHRVHAHPEPSPTWTSGCSRFPGPTPLLIDRALRAAVHQDGAQGRLLGVHQDAGQSDAQPAALVPLPASHGRPRCRHLLERRRRPSR